MISDGNSDRTDSVISSEPEVSSAWARGILRPPNMEIGSEIFVISDPRVEAGLRLTTLMFLRLRQ